jgi:hypothetical protein
VDFPSRNYQVEGVDVGRACGMNEEKRNAYRLLVGKLEGNRSLGRPTCRWVHNIKMDFVEIGWGGVGGLVWLGIGTSGELL